MDLRQLRYFVTVAEELHFDRAAARLNMAQPPLSQQIRKLEADLGVELFDRSTRPIALTNAGRTLLSEARPVVQQAEYAFELTRRAGSEGGGRLHIATVGSATSTVVPPILRAFHQRFPSIGLTVTELNSPAMIAALREGRIALAFLRPPLNDDAIASVCIVAEPFVIALPRNHRHVEGPIALDVLRDEPLVCLARSEAPGLHDEMLRLCRDAGFRPRIYQYANRFQTIVALVAAGLGYAIVPKSVERAGVDGVRFVPMQGAQALARLNAAWRKNDTSPDVLGFIEVVREHAKAPA